ncbi:hypothetical protein ACFWMR_17750 [Amycolatopsis thailandensis]
MTITIPHTPTVQHLVAVKPLPKNGHAISLHTRRRADPLGSPP